MISDVYAMSGGGQTGGGGGGLLAFLPLLIILLIVLGGAFLFSKKGNRKQVAKIVAFFLVLAILIVNIIFTLIIWNTAKQEGEDPDRLLLRIGVLIMVLGMLWFAFFRKGFRIPERKIPDLKGRSNVVTTLCESCGAEISVGATFCRKCGSKL